MSGIMDLAYSRARRIGLLRRIGSLIGYSSGITGFETTSFDHTERTKSDLHRLFYDNEGPVVHKWQHYLSVYDRHLSQFRERPIRFLEIGVFKGGSLHLWRKYFGPQAVLFGIDIDKDCAQFDGRDAQIRIGSQDDPKFLSNVIDEMGGIDVVVDDGSHVAKHQTLAFETLFPRLTENGMYICEDMHTNYWRGWYQGGHRRQSTFLEKTKRIVDDIHSDFHNHGDREGTNASRSIHGIHFYNSMVIIEKAPQQRPSHIQIGN